MLGFDGEYSAVQPKAKFWCFLVKDCKKSAVKHSIEKPILLKFLQFVSNLLSKIVWGNKISFVTCSRPLDFIFSKVFSLWKVSFALQIDISGKSVAKNTSIWDLSKYSIFHFSVKYEFDTKHCSSCSRAVINKRYKIFDFFLLKTDHF